VVSLIQRWVMVGSLVRSGSYCSLPNSIHGLKLPTQNLALRFGVYCSPDHYPDSMQPHLGALISSLGAFQVLGRTYSWPFRHLEIDSSNSNTSNSFATHSISSSSSKTLSSPSARTSSASRICSSLRLSAVHLPSGRHKAYLE
jgi:hypothetical protein